MLSHPVYTGCPESPSQRVGNSFDEKNLGNLLDLSYEGSVAKQRRERCQKQGGFPGG